MTCTQRKMMMTLAAAKTSNVYQFCWKSDNKKGKPTIVIGQKCYRSEENEG